MTKTPFLPSLLALAGGMACAQSPAPPQTPETLPTVTVSARSQAPVSTAGFGDTPVARLPLQALRVDAERLAELGSPGLAALPLLDASVSDSYNALGYWAQLKVRGFDLDPRFNLRRDGLPVSGETALDLFNTSALELLKGTSGAQAGVSSPAGLLNLVVKRPDAPRLDLRLDWEHPGTVGAAFDWARREGPVAWRLNASAARLNPWLRNSRGERHGLALATEWRVQPGTRLEVEAETGHQSQPSQPGFSLLGDRLPAPTEVDRLRNLNDSPWRLPVVFDNQLASVRLTQELAAGWALTLQAGAHRARTDDRVAFPFGCSAEEAWDRYCSDGRFDRYDYRSEGERRRSDSQRAVLEGRRGPHHLRLEALVNRQRATFQRQAYNWAGTGSVFGPEDSQAAPELTDENTHRREHSTEWGLTEVWSAAPDLDLFVGLRHTRLQRASVRTDGSRATDIAQSFSTPWLGASWRLAPALQLYASAGEGVESEVAPNRARYLNRGQALPALRSRQLEVGLKRGSARVDWSLAAFRIRRPLWSDRGPCEADASCLRTADGHARHRGLEAQADLKWSGGGLLASALWLQAQREGAHDPALNGLAPVNVPQRQLKLTARQHLGDGWAVRVHGLYEGSRAVTADGHIRLPAWLRWDAQLQWESVGGAARWRWHMGVQNLTNQQAWKESPMTFGHHYLFPLPPRGWQAGLEVRL